MANMKNAKKKIKQIEKVTLANHIFKKTASNAIKNTEKAIISNNKENAQSNLKNAIKSLDNAKNKGLIHPNKVSREKSRLTKKVNNME